MNETGADSNKRPEIVEQVVIRDETPDDIRAIHEVTAAAFATLEISNQTEPQIIEALRKDGALAVSLVAERHGQVVGHVAFSPVAISDGTEGWYGLGPVSVLPSLHGRGIGQTLIRQGLSHLQSLGAAGCCLVGDPAFYKRFGFANSPCLAHPGIPQEFFQAIAFDGTVPTGQVTFHQAFAADAPQ